MKPVYQTEVSKESGNCMQAAIAAMFELELQDVPNFIEYGDEWYWRYSKFLEDRGFDVETISCFDMDENDLYLELLSRLTVNGAIYASVRSETLEDCSHAVLINPQGVVIHDPNPNKRFLGRDIVASGDLIDYENIFPLDYYPTVR